MPDGSAYPLVRSLSFELALDNWARWARTRRGLSHCGSIEHRYRPPDHWHPAPVQVPVDVFAALDVERELRQLPHKQQKAIVWHYVHLAPDRFICRRYGIQHAIWQQFLVDSLLMLRNRLRRRGVVCTNALTT